MSLPSIAHGGFDTRVVEADGLATHYLEGGSGPALVLIHGGGAGADGWGNWNTCLDIYAVEYRVLVPDMPGFGRTAKPDPETYSYDQAGRTRHLIAFLDALTIDSASLIGNSMGGATALGVAMQQSERVEKLVLMGSAGLAIANSDRSHMGNLTNYDFSIDGMRRIVETLTGSDCKMDEALVLYRHEIMKDPAARAALKAIVSSHLSFEREAISTVRTPTLVVGGKEDKIAVLERTYGYLELLENSWGFILPHVGHWAMIEAPDEFLAVTTAFLRNEMFGSQG